MVKQYNQATLEEAAFPDKSQHLENNNNNKLMLIKSGNQQTIETETKIKKEVQMDS